MISDQENLMRMISTVRIKQEFNESFHQNQIGNIAIDHDQQPIEIDLTEDSIEIKCEPSFEIENNQNIDPNQQNVFNAEIIRNVMMNTKNSESKKSRKESIPRCTGRIGVQKHKRYTKQRMRDISQVLNRTIKSTMFNISMHTDS